MRGGLISMGSVLLWIVILGGIIFLLNKFFMNKQDKYSNTHRSSQRPREDNPAVGNVYDHQTDHQPEERVTHPTVSQGDLEHAAKELFVTLQDAWNNEKLAVLQKRTSADVFTKVQSAERHQSISIVALTAQVQELKQSPEGHVKAKVIYSGQLRQGNGQPYDFREVWHVSREAADAVLKVEGIGE
ncbi:hypothetical protein [Piscirickettsia salmonis]|nr:hypothetical protein [Piscirickettsia salmonis]